MFYILGFVITGLLFSQALRYGQGKGANILAVVAVNYVVASVLTLGGMLTKDIPWGEVVTIPVVLVGGINGVLYFVHIPLIMGSYRLVGVGITSALMRTGAVIPAIVAWYAWNELMGPARWTALALVPVAMILMNHGESYHPRITLRADLIMFGCFLLAGLIFTIHKYAEIHFSTPELEVYKTALFVGAAISSMVYNVAQRTRFTSREIRIGLFIGLSNALGLMFILLGLAVVPAVIFYPTSSCLGIIVNVLVSRWLWKERLLKQQVIGIVLAITIVLLINATVK